MKDTDYRIKKKEHLDVLEDEIADYSECSFLNFENINSKLESNKEPIVIEDDILRRVTFGDASSLDFKFKNCMFQDVAFSNINKCDFNNCIFDNNLFFKYIDELNFEDCCYYVSEENDKHSVEFIKCKNVNFYKGYFFGKSCYSAFELEESNVNFTEVEFRNLTNAIISYNSELEINSCIFKNFYDGFSLRNTNCKIQSSEFINYKGKIISSLVESNLDYNDCPDILFENI